MLQYFNNILRNYRLLYIFDNHKEDYNIIFILYIKFIFSPALFSLSLCLFFTSDLAVYQTINLNKSNEKRSNNEKAKLENITKGMCG